MPYTYITPMSFAEASSLIKTWANNELLESMQLLQDTYNDFMNEDRSISYFLRRNLALANAPRYLACRLGVKREVSAKSFLGI